MPTLTGSVVRVRHNGAASAMGLLGGSWVHSKEQGCWRYTGGLSPNSFSVWPQANCLTPVSKPRFQIQICSSYLVGLLPARAYEMQGPGLDVTDKHRGGPQLAMLPNFLAFPSLPFNAPQPSCSEDHKPGKSWGWRTQAIWIQVRPPPRPHCLVSDKPLGPSELQVPRLPPRPPCCFSNTAVTPAPKLR